MQTAEAPERVSCRLAVIQARPESRRTCRGATLWNSNSAPWRRMSTLVTEDCAVALGHQMHRLGVAAHQQVPDWSLSCMSLFPVHAHVSLSLFQSFHINSIFFSLFLTHELREVERPQL